MSFVLGKGSYLFVCILCLASSLSAVDLVSLSCVPCLALSCQRVIIFGTLYRHHIPCLCLCLCLCPCLCLCLCLVLVFIFVFGSQNNKILFFLIHPITKKYVCLDWSVTTKFLIRPKSNDIILKGTLATSDPSVKANTVFGQCPEEG